MDNYQSLAYFWPEFILVGTAIVAILMDLHYQRAQSYKVGYWVLAGFLLAQIAIFVQPHETLTLFLDSVAFDPFGRFFKTVIILATFFILVVSPYSNELKNYRTGEYYILIAIMAFGMFLMVSALDLIMVYLSIEVVSITSFVLAGYLRKDKRSNESALKYVIYGAFSSGLMLFGLSILFGLTGTTKLFEIRSALGQLDSSANYALILSAILILAGFGYKISIVPFHFWTPDVYEGAPTTITAYLSVAPKAAGFAILIRFFHTVFTDGGALSAANWIGDTGLPWPQLLAVLSVVTMTLGNVVALQQTSVKRMLAYSSIAHAGYMLMALPLLSGEGLYAIMLYLVMYLFMNLGAFIVVIAVKNKTGEESFEAFRGLGWEMPFLGMVMMVFMFSLTGLPPTAGFIGKFYLFAAVIKAGPQFYWLAIIGVLNSVVSLYYYLRVMKMMFLEGEHKDVLTTPATMVTVVLICLAIPALVFGIFWSPVADWVNQSLMFFTQGM
ncbi:MAG: NADH-quinone oxidoreductase subunit N [FCB group bacterium]|nr:NADH-quinone oxidoreductase subunit N [FCB group bacterium]